MRIFRRLVALPAVLCATAVYAGSPIDPWLETVAIGDPMQRLTWANGSGPSPNLPGKSAPEAQAPAKSQPPAQAPVMQAPAQQLEVHHYYHYAPAQAPVYAQPQSQQAPVMQSPSTVLASVTTSPPTQVVKPAGPIRRAIGRLGTELEKVGHDRARLVPAKIVTTWSSAPTAAPQQAPVYSAPPAPAVPSAQQ